MAPLNTLRLEILVKKGSVFRLTSLCGQSETEKNMLINKNISLKIKPFNFFKNIEMSRWIATSPDPEKEEIEEEMNRCY